MVRCRIVLGDDIPKILPMYSEVHPSSNGIETEWASAMPTGQSIPIGLSSDGPMTAHHIVTFRAVASYAKFFIYFNIRTHFLYFTLPQQYNIYIKSFIIHSLFWTLLSFYLSLSLSLSLTVTFQADIQRMKVYFIYVLQLELSIFYPHYTFPTFPLFLSSFLTTYRIYFIPEKCYG